MITIEDAYSYFYNERLFSDDWLMAENNKQEQSLKMASNLKKAICEQALYLIKTQNTQRSRLIEQGVTSFNVEGLSESYDISKARKKVCTEAIEYLKPYLIGCASIC